MKKNNEHDTAAQPASADTNDLASAIERIVLQRRSVTIPELREHLGPVFDGDRRLCDETDPNKVYWAGVSRAFGDALGVLVADGRIEVRIVSPQMHMLASGSVLTLSHGRRTPRGKYKRPRWLPTYFEAPGSGRRRGAARREYQASRRRRRPTW